MELYVLDDLHRRNEIIDQFDSLIWTERYAAFGEFELNIDATPDNIRNLKTDRFLALNESYRIMRIETVLNAIGKDGRRMLTVKGRSIEIILEDRVAWIDFSERLWVRSGLPAEIARYMFRKSCLFAELEVDADDAIPNISVGSPLPASTIPEPSESVVMSFNADSAYNTIKKICDTYALGFRIVRLTDSPQLYFDVYTGDNRTTSQTVFAPVIFAPELDNLQDTRELRSTAGYKNFAYVTYEAPDDLNYFGYAYGENTPTDVTGFERRVLLVKTTEVLATTNPEITLELNQKGLEALAEHRSTLAFDGEIDTIGSYKYGTDYYLGDLVEIRNTTGTTNVMRVTEQVFVSDREGERSYPTLTLNFMVVGGTWNSWEYNKTWLEMGATDYWEDA